MPRKGFLGGGLLLMGLSQACGDPVGPKPPDPITQLPRALTLSEQIVIARSNTFGFDLLQEVDSRREAAAATSVGVGITSAPPGLTLDRPYLLAIQERLSGTVLFLGAVRDPR